MKRVLASLAIMAAAAPVMAADIGISIGIEQPGIYGRIDIGHVRSAPVLVYPQPVVVMPSPVAVYQRPIYLHVPPGHAKRWKNYCGRYQACGQPVYFVQDGWYRDVYAPAYYGRRAERWDKQDRKHFKEQQKQQRKHEKRHHKKYDD